MINTCNELQRRPNEWRRAIEKIEDEHKRRDREAGARRDAENTHWLRRLQSRLARAGCAPSLADLDLATNMQPSFRRGGAFLTWNQFADQDPRAAAELCQRLARMARADDRSSDHAAALTDAGLR